MVSLKSKKKPVKSKHTYAERVLEAFSQAQREHRRHAIHLATLRAQVRRFAQAREESLGPQWSTWVKRAIHKLEDEGIFEPAEHSGSISLTPAGKNAIAATRRNVHYTDHRIATPNGEGTRVASSGRKRGHQEDESSFQHTSPTPRKKQTRRRRSPAVGFSDKSPSKMTKPELLVELKMFRRQSMAAAMRRMAEIEKKLKQREAELDVLRRQQGHPSATADTERLANGGQTNRSSSPSSDVDNEVSSPLTPGTSIDVPITRPIEDATRIPPDAANQVPDNPHSDFYADGASHDVDHGSPGSPIGFNNAQPSLTPAASAEFRGAYGNKISALEKLLATRNSAYDELKRAADESQDRLSALVSNVSQRDARILELETRLKERESSLSVQTEAAISSQNRLIEFNDQLTSLREDISSLNRDNEGLSRRLSTSLAERASLESSLASAEASLDAMRNELASLKADLSRAERAEADARSKLSSETVRLRNELELERQRIHDLEEALTETTERMVEAEAAKEVDEDTIQNLKETFNRLKQVQMASLAEFNTKVSHSSPAPRSRRSSNIFATDE